MKLSRSLSIPQKVHQPTGLLDRNLSEILQVIVYVIVYCVPIDLFNSRASKLSYYFTAHHFSTNLPGFPLRGFGQDDQDICLKDSSAD